MKIRSAFIPVMVLLIFGIAPTAEADEMVWGENVGLISAVVTGTDDAEGLTVRSTPSSEGKVLTHLKSSTTIQADILFRGGWVKLKAPVQDGWAPIKFLKPHPVEGTVTKVNRADMCLPLKKGPGDTHEKVGCAQIGETLKFSGVATSDNWLQLADRTGWAPASHVQLEVWTTAAGTGQKPASLTLTRGPTDQGKVAEKPAVAHQPEPGFPSLPIDEEDKGETPEAEICQGQWCVDFIKQTITRQGKPESFVGCARDEICATILSEFWVALLEDEAHLDIPISSAMSFRLEKDGTIKNAKSGTLLENCRGASGPEAGCVAEFLLELSRPLLGVTATDKPEPTAAVPTKQKTEVSKAQLQRQPSTPVASPEKPISSPEGPVQKKSDTPAKPGTPSAMVATVNKVDQPDQCLRIRQGPGPNHTKVGCVELGALLTLTGVVKNNWVEVREPLKGWVTASQISASGAFPAKPATSGQRAQQKVPGSSPTTKMFTDPAFDQQAQTQKQIEEAWADARGRGF